MNKFADVFNMLRRIYVVSNRIPVADESQWCAICKQTICIEERYVSVSEGGTYKVCMKCIAVMKCE